MSFKRWSRGGLTDAGGGREEGGQHWGGGDHPHHQHSGQLQLMLFLFIIVVKFKHRVFISLSHLKNFIFGSVRSSRSHKLRLFIRLVQVCLKLLFFILMIKLLYLSSPLGRSFRQIRQSLNTLFCQIPISHFDILIIIQDSPAQSGEVIINVGSEWEGQGNLFRDFV